MSTTVAIDCDRCVRGTWTRSDGSRWRCAYCSGTGRRTIETRSHPKGLDAETQAHMIELYTSGLSMREVGEQTYTAQITVHDVLVEYGVPRRPTGGSKPRLTTEQLLEVGELYAQGLTQREIGALIGIDRRTVDWRLTRLGAIRRSRSEAARIGAERRRRRDLSGSQTSGSAGI